MSNPTTSSTSNNSGGGRPMGSNESNYNRHPSSSLKRRSQSSSYQNSTKPSSLTSHFSLSPRRDYFSRRSSSQIRTYDLPVGHDAVGLLSPWALLWGCIFLTVPFAYIYILLIVLRELCRVFPETLFTPMQTYLPWLASIITLTMQPVSKFVEVWCIMEGVYYVFAKLYILWLQCKDPLEASLSSAPMMELDDRQLLWQRMLETEEKDPVTFISGWFFDSALEHISKYDIRDFLAWSMFEGRNQEHLTSEELAQLERFVEDLEWRISIHLYGTVVEEEEHENDENNEEGCGLEADDDNTEHAKEGTKNVTSSDLLSTPQRYRRDSLGYFSESGFASPRERNGGSLPKRRFRFPDETSDGQPNFFSNLYESYKVWYEQYRGMVENTDFHPVQDFRNFMAEKAQQLLEAEESAMATANQMYENAYHTLVQPGSSMDKQLSAIGHATQVQLTEAWNSVKEMRERLQTAEFLSSQRKRIRQQLKGYRNVLNRMRAMSSAVPSKQMAVLMRRITACNDALERQEARAREAFVKATGFARKNLMLTPKDPQRYAKYSSDPLLGIATYPLGFQLLLLAGTEIPLRVWMHQHGFQRLVVGPVAYYYHPGTRDMTDDDEEGEKTPLVFVHGIGVGLIVYLPLIARFLQSGRPIFLPEIPYVSGFRFWQGPNAVLAPAVVASTMTAMFATHGYERGTFCGHSYGTSWLSYMCKYAPHAVAAVVFLDPICFCLHVPRLTKQFVYHRPDPGSISYIVLTDVIVNWTIQRSFPWAWIILFEEQIQVPCVVFLSEKDALVPSAKVEAYLRSKGAPVRDINELDSDFFATNEKISVCVFPGDGHGGWTARMKATCPIFGDCVETLCTRAEAEALQQQHQQER